MSVLDKKNMHFMFAFLFKIALFGLWIILLLLSSIARICSNRMMLKNVKEIMLSACFLSSEWDIVEFLLVHASKNN